MVHIDGNPDPKVFSPNLDKWDGAVAARDRLFAAVESAKLGNLVVVTGDVHQNWAELKKNFSEENQPRLDPNAFKLRGKVSVSEDSRLPASYRRFPLAS
jgi:phosphodiesterase/alkaline phosphatase D-like protein